MMPDGTLSEAMRRNPPVIGGQRGRPTGMTATRTEYGIPEGLMKEIAGVKGQLTGLAAQDPYAGMHGAWEDVIRSMAGAYQTRGSRAARTTRETALSSGLSPLEAGGLGEEALSENLRRYYEMLPGMRLEQAGLQQKRWQDIAGLMSQWTSLADIAGRGAVPTGTETMGYEFGPEPGAGAGAFAARGEEGGFAARPSAMERAQTKLILAQVAEMVRRTEARERMNELFYGGGLGPIAGGGGIGGEGIGPGAGVGQGREITVSPAVQQQNEYEALLKFLMQLGQSDIGLRGMRGMTGQPTAAEGTTAGTATAGGQAAGRSILQRVAGGK